LRRDDRDLACGKPSRLQHHVTNGSRLSIKKNRSHGKKLGEATIHVSLTAGSRRIDRLAAKLQLLQ
jgi:hypothetical protein